MIEITQIEQYTREIAIQLLGQPNEKLSSNGELRFGSHGSMSVDLEGKWYDHETMEGGGMISLIKKYHGDNVAEFLRSVGIQDLKPVAIKKVDTPIQTLSDQDMRDKANQAVLVSRYSPDFCVMRFEGKVIRPFSRLKNGAWVMKRPEGLLPLMITPDRDESLPYLLVEGETAFKAAALMYEGSVATWHGGTGSANKQDWSALSGKEIIIWPDNDEPGTKVSKEIKGLLESLRCKVSIVMPPPHFQAKDDLMDAHKRGEEINIIEYAKANELDARQSVIYQKYGDFKDHDYPEMKVMVGDDQNTLFHYGGQNLLFGAAGSGKSLLSQYLCLSLAAGVDFAHYHIAQPQKVLLIDAEMAPVSLQTRFQSQIDGILSGNPQKEELIKRINENFVIVSHYDQPEGLAPLNTPEGKDWYLDLIEQVQPNFCVWDNLMNLTSFEDNNSAEEFVRFINPLLLKMRAENRTTMMLHHAGKSGKQLGSVSKEILLDVSIKISVPQQDDEEDHIMDIGGDYETNFLWQFKKGRHIYGHNVADINWRYSNGLLTRMKSDREARIETVAQYKQSGLSNRAIAKELKVSPSTIDKDVKYAKSLDLYDDDSQF